MIPLDCISRAEKGGFRPDQALGPRGLREIGGGGGPMALTLASLAAIRLGWFLFLLGSS